MIVVIGACTELWQGSISLHSLYGLYQLAEVVVILVLCACHSIAFVSPVSSGFVEHYPIFGTNSRNAVGRPVLSLQQETDLFLQAVCSDSPSMPYMDLLINRIAYIDNIRTYSYLQLPLVITTSPYMEEWYCVLELNYSSWP